VQHLASRAQYRKGDTIYYQDGPAEYGYLIVTGAARECALRPDGRRQVVGFLMPGDMFGFCTPQVHRFSGETIAETTTIARYPRHRVEMLAESDPEVARHFRQLATEAIERLQTRMAVLARPTALEKVSSFLLHMTESVAGSSNKSIVLPMSRYDIADYLALSVETVSRTITELRQRRVVEFFSARHVSIINRARLQWYSENCEP
jgi:CRP-like cAMP-binding protein